MRLRRRHAVQIAIGLVLSVALYGVLLVWMPYLREMRIADRISQLEGRHRVETLYCGPAWMSLWVQTRIPFWNRIRRIDVLGVPSGTSRVAADIGTLSELETLLLRGSDVTDLDLVHLKRLRKLKILDLRETAITDVGLQHVGQMTSLRRLYLGDTQVTDAGLANLKELVNLELLDLDQTQISDEGMQHLQTLTKLNQLGVGQSKVTDAGLEMLHRLPNFVYLNVERTQVSIKERVRLRELFPKCTIKTNP